MKIAHLCAEIDDARDGLTMFGQMSFLLPARHVVPNSLLISLDDLTTTRRAANAVFGTRLFPAAHALSTHHCLGTFVVFRSVQSFIAIGGPEDIRIGIGDA